MATRVERAVSALAACDMVTTMRIYYEGELSESYAAFQKVQRVASEQELVGLLGHDSPVVRGYAARHVAREMPAYVELLLPLLRDPAPLTTMAGCNLYEGTVAELVAEELADAAPREVIRRGLRELRRLEGAREVLERVAQLFPDDDDTDPGV